jgi:hypothetical protein
MVVVDSRWAQSHWRTIAASYARAPHFAIPGRLRGPVRGLEGALARGREPALYPRDLRPPRDHDEAYRSSDYELIEGRTERIVSLCRQAGATRYLLRSLGP